MFFQSPKRQALLSQIVEALDKVNQTGLKFSPGYRTNVEAIRVFGGKSNRDILASILTALANSASEKELSELQLRENALLEVLEHYLEEAKTLAATESFRDTDAAYLVFCDFVKEWNTSSRHLPPSYAFDCMTAYAATCLRAFYSYAERLCRTLSVSFPNPVKLD